MTWTPKIVNGPCVPRYVLDLTELQHSVEPISEQRLSEHISDAKESTWVYDPVESFPLGGVMATGRYVRGFRHGVLHKTFWVS